MFVCLAVVTAWVALLGSSAGATESSSSRPIVGEVRNLSVGVVAFDDETDEVDSGELDYATLKLNVSWMPPEGGRRPSFYSVLITSVHPNSTNQPNTNLSNKHRNDVISSCTEGSIYYAGQDVNQTHVLLPENRFSGTLQATAIATDEAVTELEIEPACIYRVQVFANPRNNLGASPSTVYRVPDCVGGRCNCDRALEGLPVPVVGLKNLYNGSTLVSWRIEMGHRHPTHAVDSYKISVGIPHLTSSSGLVIYNKTHIYTGAADEDSFLWNQDKLKKGTKIFVAAQDSYGCSGREGSYTVKRVRHHPFYRKNATAIVFVGFIVLCLIISGIFSFIRYFARNHNYKLISLRQKSTRQITSVLHNPKIEALLKNHNILYVEQEIEDARRKDLVDEHEISYKRLRLVSELGQGQFGKVYLANLLWGCSQRREEDENEEEAKEKEVKEGRLVAVKMSLTSSDSARAQLEVRQELLEEIGITKMAGSHPHLVGLVGCCTLPTNPVCLVLEYMRGGDLLGYLHRMRDSAAPTIACSCEDRSPLESPGVHSVAETTCTSLGSRSPSTPTSQVFFPNDIKPEDVVGLEAEGPINYSEMMRFALEIARGMEHLEAKSIVHRDLAARNVLMDENLVLKISDFGLSRKGAYTLQGGAGVRRLPIRWMPPEAIRRRAFTSKSDVWSYGLVLWEIARLGDFPYTQLSDDELLRHLLEDGGRPEQPSNAPPGMRELMELCWAGEPERRPNFGQIVLWLESKYRQECKNNPAYQDLVSNGLM